MSSPPQPKVPRRRPWWADRGWLEWYLHDSQRIRQVENQLTTTFNDFFPDYSAGPDMIVNRQAKDFVARVKLALATHRQLIALQQPSLLQKVELNNSRKAINALLDAPLSLIESQFSAIFWSVVLRFLRLQVVQDEPVREVREQRPATEGMHLCNVINELVDLCGFEADERKPFLVELDKTSMKGVLKSIVSQLQLPKNKDKARRRVKYYYIQSVRGTIINLAETDEQQLVVRTRVLVSKLKDERRFFNGEKGLLAQVNPKFDRFFVWSTWPRMPTAEPLPGGRVQLPSVAPTMPDLGPGVGPASPTSNATSGDESDAEQLPSPLTPRPLRSEASSTSRRSASIPRNGQPQEVEYKSSAFDLAESPAAGPESRYGSDLEQDDDVLSDYQDDLLPSSSDSVRTQAERPIRFDPVSMLRSEVQMSPQQEVDFAETQQAAFEAVLERINLRPSSQQQKEDVFKVTQDHLLRLLRISTSSDQEGNLKQDWTLFVSISYGLMEAAGSKLILPSGDQAERATPSVNNLVEPWQMLAESIEFSCREKPITNARPAMLVVALLIIIRFLHTDLLVQSPGFKWFRASHSALVRLLTDLIIKDMNNFVNPSLVSSVFKKRQHFIGPVEGRSPAPKRIQLGNVPRLSETIDDGRQPRSTQLVSPPNSNQDRPVRPSAAPTVGQSTPTVLEIEPETQVRVRLADADQLERSAELVIEPANGRFVSPVEELARSDLPSSPELLSVIARPTLQARRRSVPSVDAQTQDSQRPSSPSPQREPQAVRSRSPTAARPSGNVLRPDNFWQRWFSVPNPADDQRAGARSARTAPSRPVLRRGNRWSRPNAQPLPPFVPAFGEGARPFSASGRPTPSQVEPQPARSLYNPSLRFDESLRPSLDSARQLPPTVKVTPAQASRQINESLERQSFRLEQENRELVQERSQRQQMALQAYRDNYAREQARQLKAAKAKAEREADCNKRLAEARAQADAEVAKLEALAAQRAQEIARLRSQLEQAPSRARPEPTPSPPPVPTSPPARPEPSASPSPLASPAAESRPPSSPAPSGLAAHPEAARDALAWLLFAFVATE